MNQTNQPTNFFSIYTRLYMLGYRVLLVHASVKKSVQWTCIKKNDRIYLVSGAVTLGNYITSEVPCPEFLGWLCHFPSFIIIITLLSPCLPPPPPHFCKPWPYILVVTRRPTKSSVNETLNRHKKMQSYYRKRRR